MSRTRRRGPSQLLDNTPMPAWGPPPLPATIPEVTEMLTAVPDELLPVHVGLLPTARSGACEPS